MRLLHPYKLTNSKFSFISIFLLLDLLSLATTIAPFLSRNSVRNYMWPAMHTVGYVTKDSCHITSPYKFMLCNFKRETPQQFFSLLIITQKSWHMKSHYGSQNSWTILWNFESPSWNDTITMLKYDLSNSSMMVANDFFFTLWVLEFDGSWEFSHLLLAFTYMHVYVNPHEMTNSALFKHIKVCLRCVMALKKPLHFTFFWPLTCR